MATAAKEIEKSYDFVTDSKEAVENVPSEEDKAKKEKALFIKGYRSGIRTGILEVKWRRYDLTRIFFGFEDFILGILAVLFFLYVVYLIFQKNCQLYFEVKYMGWCKF